MLYQPGTTLTIVGPDGSSVTGTTQTGADGTLELLVIGQTLVLTGVDGVTLRPRWASCVISVVEPPRPPEPGLPYAIVVASSKDVAGRAVWVRMPTGAWRTAAQGRYVSDWAGLRDIEVKFPGLP